MARNDELDEVEGWIKDEVASLDKAVKSVVQLGTLQELEDIQKKKY